MVVVCGVGDKAAMALAWGFGAMRESKGLVYIIKIVLEFSL